MHFVAAAIEEKLGRKRGPKKGTACTRSGLPLRRRPSPTAPVEHDVVTDQRDTRPLPDFRAGTQHGRWRRPPGRGRPLVVPTLTPAPAMPFWPSSTGCPWRRWPMLRSSRHCLPCRTRTQPGFSTSWRRPDASSTRRRRSSSTAPGSSSGRSCCSSPWPSTSGARWSPLSWRWSTTCWPSKFAA